MADKVETAVVLLGCVVMGMAMSRVFDGEPLWGVVVVVLFAAAIFRRVQKQRATRRPG